jgi:hypothetical protein
MNSKRDKLSASPFAFLASFAVQKEGLYRKEYKGSTKFTKELNRQPLDNLRVLCG